MTDPTIIAEARSALSALGLRIVAGPFLRTIPPKGNRQAINIVRVKAPVDARFAFHVLGLDKKQAEALGKDAQGGVSSLRFLVEGPAGARKFRFVTTTGRKKIGSSAARRRGRGAGKGASAAEGVERSTP